MWRVLRGTLPPARPLTQAEASGPATVVLRPPHLPTCPCVQADPLPHMGSEGLLTEVVRGKNTVLGEDSSVDGIFRNT